MFDMGNCRFSQYSGTTLIPVELQKIFVLSGYTIYQNINKTYKNQVHYTS